MNRETIRNLVLEATKRTDKVSLINSAIDLAIEEVSSQRLWSDLQIEAEVTTIANVASISLASDLTRLVEVRLIDDNFSRPLLIRPKTWLVKYFPDAASQSSARPVYAYLEGTTLIMIPIPDQAYTLRYTYYKLQTSLTSDSDEVLIRAAGKVVAAYATFWVFQCTQQEKDANMWLATYFKLLNSAKKVDKDNSAIQKIAEQRGNEPGAVADYWLDPFVRSAP